MAWTWLALYDGYSMAIPHELPDEISSDAPLLDWDQMAHGNTTFYTNEQTAGFNKTWTTNDNCIANYYHDLSTGNYRFTLPSEGYFSGGFNIEQGLYGSDFGIAINIDLQEAIPLFVSYLKWGAQEQYLAWAWYFANWRDGSQYANLRRELFSIVSPIVSTGGGATHIARVSGHLSTLSSNLSNIIIVSGGGGSGMVYSSNSYVGADAGGIQGNNTNSANQITGYAFGAGNSLGGGSGLYGGYAYDIDNLISPGAGSGYIGNSLLADKKMVGYNVPTSSAEGTKTLSVNTYSASGEANQPKAGNGKARITFLRPYVPPPSPVPPEYQEMCDKIATKQIGIESNIEFDEALYSLTYAGEYYEVTYNRTNPRQGSYITRANSYSFATDRIYSKIFFYISNSDNIFDISYDTSTGIATYNNVYVSNSYYTCRGSDFCWFYCDYDDAELVYSATYSAATARGYNTTPSLGGTLTTSFSNVGDFITYIYSRFRHVNVYVDGDQWVTAS